MFDLIAFDADDTLWHNERYYHLGRDRFRAIMAPYGLSQLDDAEIDAIEVGNLPAYGYGAMSFVLSLIEAAVKLTEGQVSGRDVGALVALAKEMLTHEVELLEGAAATVSGLAKTHTLMLITKGALHHQRAKVDASGLADYFDHIEIVGEKSPDVYAGILARTGVAPERFLMVGNSMRSDILPVIALGGWAVHVPNRLTWAHEAIEPPEEARDHYHEIPGLAQLPALIASLAARGANP
jgi:putative hydrolase of the HAD superfamily